jgi:hypothetical protein
MRQSLQTKPRVAPDSTILYPSSIQQRVSRGFAFIHSHLIPVHPCIKNRNSMSAPEFVTAYWFCLLQLHSTYISCYIPLNYSENKCIPPNREMWKHFTRLFSESTLLQPWYNLLFSLHVFFFPQTTWKALVSHKLKIVRYLP